MNLERASLQDLRELELLSQRLELLEERRRLEGSLIEFFEAAWSSIDPAPFVYGWHLDAIAEHLQAVAEGQIRRLLINVPPRCSKTLLTSVAFPAWVWARQPDPDMPLVGPQVKFLCLSYGDALAMDNATMAHRLVMSEWFQARWGQRVQITADQDAKNKFDTTAGGSRISSSFGGGVLGRGGDIKIIDDPHKVDEAESDHVRERVIRTYDGTLKSRITDPKIAAEIIIMQRLHEHDLAGHVLADDDVVHLMLPAEHDPDRHCVTVLGWEDPRTEPGELLCPERFGDAELAKFRINPYEWAGQWQQRPQPRGGIIFRREWWKVWEPPDGKFPPLDYVVASLDGAFTRKEENDPSGFTVWGLFRDHTSIQGPDGQIIEQEHPVNKVILLDAWRKHLEMHGPIMDPTSEEQAAMLAGDDITRRAAKRRFEERCRPRWGLVEWVAHSCRRFKVDRLLIEAGPAGITAAQEMRRLYGDELWSTEEVTARGDKLARALAVTPIFTQELVYAPDREWAEMVIQEMEAFPKGMRDDLTDSTTQALKHLRVSGLLDQPAESRLRSIEAARFKPQRPALYAV